MSTGFVYFPIDTSGIAADRKVYEVRPVHSSDTIVQPDPSEQAQLKDLLAEHDITLRFSQDQTTKSVVVELIDENTGEQIRQIPSEVSLKLAAAFVKLQGQFLDRRQ